MTQRSALSLPPLYTLNVASGTSPTGIGDLAENWVMRTRAVGGAVDVGVDCGLA
jgi:hypothetical protein